MEQRRHEQGGYEQGQYEQGWSKGSQIRFLQPLPCAARLVALKAADERTREHLGGEAAGTSIKQCSF